MSCPFFLQFRWKFFLCRVLYNLLSNPLVPAGLKSRLRGAARAGRADGTCSQFRCTYTADAKPPQRAGLAAPRQLKL